MGGFIVREFKVPAKPGQYELKVPQGSLIMSIQRNIGQDPYLLIFGWPEAETHLGQADLRKVVCVKSEQGLPVNLDYRLLGTIKTGILYSTEESALSHDLHYFEAMKPTTTKA